VARIDALRDTNGRLDYGRREKNKMKTRMIRKLAVLVTGSALALSFPVASSFAVPPGNGNDNNHCGKSAGKGNGPKPNSNRQALNNNGKGWKCGLDK
jgi:hypothetical protein